MRMVQAVACVGLLASTGVAGGLLPDRINQLIIEGRFDSPQPQFLVVFSARRLTDAGGKPLVSATAEELQGLKSSRD